MDPGLNLKEEADWLSTSIYPSQSMTAEGGSVASSMELMASPTIVTVP